ncbi:hypothetical protein [Thiomicrospira sp. ALE5]|uniref:c-type cytochrome n=1 Tax=Thiomicrospira sp. ALE5 TaxID=748650 RepID=UPI0008E4282B|nr:hypothetical protein [Thiomicrospira sp. ALE5]SFR54394.1 Cytochrome c553 [Thiomicrospira sp. ALE5]
MTKKAFMLVAAGLLFSQSALAHPDNNELRYDPEAMAWLCAPCHGTNGREFGESMPGLAGLDADYFIEVMQQFKRGERAAVIMDRVAKGFTDDEIAAMAQWFAAQPKTQWTGELNHD